MPIGILDSATNLSEDKSLKIEARRQETFGFLSSDFKLNNTILNNNGSTLCLTNHSWNIFNY